MISPLDEPRLMALLPQLENLTSLKVHRVWHHDAEEPESFVIDHSGLRNLHMSHFKVKDLTLECPGLSSLIMDCCFVHGHLSLQAPLEELSCGPTFVPCVREGFAVSDFLGLTQLQCLLGEWDSLQMLYELLPMMSRLKALSLVLKSGSLPERLPPSLQVTRYFLTGKWYFTRHIAVKTLEDTCQLPKLQSITYVSSQGWSPWTLCFLKQITRDAKAQVILEKKMTDEVCSLRDEAFF